MQKLRLNAQLREEIGTRSARRLRDDGEVPVVLYGHHQTPVNLTVDAKELRQVIGKNALINLEVGNEAVNVIVKDVQRTSVKHEIMHADLQAVEMNEEIHITVPVHLLGISALERYGCVVQHLLHEVEVECLPTEIPEHLELDISMMEIGDSVTVSQLVLNSDVTILTPANEVIATIVSAKAGEVEDSTEEQGIATRPEIDAKHDASAEEATIREEIATN